MIEPMNKLLIIVFVLCSLPVALQASSAQIIDSETTSFRLEQVAEGLGVPWGLTFLSDTRLLITERRGTIMLLDIESGSLMPIRGVPDVKASGQGGLLDVAVPPGHEAGDWIYFTFVRDILSEGVTVLARAKLIDDLLVGWQDLLETESAEGSGRHYGSRIAFDNDGHVYFGVGDRGDRPNSQQLDNHAGSIIRLHRDGRVPDDNPFLNHKDALPETWSFGHRNPQGMAYDHENDRLWSIEHGPRGGDEINLVQRGRNYGWPVISYGKEYWGPLAVGEGTHREGMEQPVKQYTPSIAPGSLLFYSGDAFPSWRGNLFSGALKLTHLNRVTLDENARAIGEERLLDDMGERIRALTESSQGWLVFSTDSGKIFIIKPTE